MIPVKIDESDYDYPSFQPDQILTADDLNHVFDFLDLQERLTRTNLIGIGIVCGLKVSKSLDGKSIFITKGTGVTSHGYLIVHGIDNSEDPIEYKKYRVFDALKEEKYPVFVTGNTQRYALWELIDKDHEINGDLSLDNSFLSDKVCLLFYEILEEKAKNCDPVSCDDKGVKVYVTVRKLLVSSGDADKIILELNQKAKATGSGEILPGIFTLAEIRLPRFDVPATKLSTANDVFQAYQSVFTQAVVMNTGNALKTAFETFKGFLKIENNPFNNFSTQFKFLYDGTITGHDLLHFQYYYDFFCDLILAYNEWRRSAHHLASMCTPPEALFPRHLFIGLIGESGGVVKSKYRNYFIPSPIHSCSENGYQEFLLLFRRLERMVQNFKIPFPSTFVIKNIDANIRVTPSVMGRNEFGDRAIPYYYVPDSIGKKLFETWSPALTLKGREKHNLHYNPTYNTTDDFVRNPLEYDLEPYNFFRVEGHIGKKYTSALAAIQSIRDKNRLPFSVIALSVDSIPGTVDPSKYPCHFEDLQALYETLWAEFMCKLCKALVCIYRLPKRASGEVSGALKKSTLKLIRGCDETLYYRDVTLGSVYEQLHDVIVKERSAGLPVLESMKRENLVKMLRVETATANEITDNETDAAIYFVQLIQLLVRLSQDMPEKLSQFNFQELSATLKKITELLRKGTSGENTVVRDRFTANQCLKDLLDLCKLAAFRAIYKEYKERLEKLKLMQTLAEYCKSHPGIQHKGGVPAGGTFILVYRDLPDKDVRDDIGDVGTSFTDFLVSDEIEVKTPPTKKVVARPKYSMQELTTINRKISTLKLKGLTNTEIEDTLEIKLVDIISAAGIFDSKVVTIPTDTVIADFYLPYICCSDCPPVQFIINIPPPKVTFGLDKLDYCGEDTNEYVFTTNPSGGKITTDQPDSVADKGSNVFAFVPSKVKIPEGQKSIPLAFTYQLEDLSQTITVTIYRKPVVKIIVKPDAENPRRFDFSMDPSLVSTAFWTFGDGKTSAEIDPQPYTYEKSGQFTVGLTVTNGPCSFKTEEVTVIVKEPEPVQIILEPTEVCRTVKELPFTVKPVGGKMIGEKVEEMPAGSGNYKFFPADVDMKGLSSRTIPFTYTSLENVSKSFSIKVFEKPEGFFTAEREGRGVMITLLKLVHADKALVDFGDGVVQTYNVAGQSEFRVPYHLYAAPGTYTVKVTLLNGACSHDLQPISVPISVSTEPIPKTCLPFTAPLDRYAKVRESMAASQEFMEAYKPVFREVESHYASLKKQMGADGRVDLLFFERSPLKPEWIATLPLNPAVARTISIQLASVFIYEMMALACERKEDISGSMQEVFGVLIGKFRELRTVNLKEKQFLTKVVEDIRKEIENVNTHNEGNRKKAYLGSLDDLVNAINNLIETH